MSTKHKPGIVGIRYSKRSSIAYKLVQSREETLSDINHKLQSVCRKKKYLKKLKKSNQQKEHDKDHIINCKPPFLFTEWNCRGVFWEAIFACKGYLWATEMCQTFLQWLWPSKPSDWHKEHELHLSSLLFAWGLGCFWMKISCWSCSQLCKTWIRNVIGKKHLQWLRGFHWAAENCSNQRCGGYCHVVIWLCSFQIHCFMF